MAALNSLSLNSLSSPSVGDAAKAAILEELLGHVEAEEGVAPPEEHE